MPREPKAKKVKKHKKRILPAFLRKIIDVSSALLTRSSVKACHVTAHNLFSKYICVETKEVLRVSFPEPRYDCPKLFTWPIKNKSQKCLILSIVWDISPNQMFTSKCHWVFYRKGQLKHSCNLSAEALVDPDKEFNFSTTIDVLKAKEMKYFEKLFTLDKNEFIPEEWAGKLIATILRCLRNKSGYANIIPIEKVWISAMHRTWIEN